MFCIVVVLTRHGYGFSIMYDTNTVFPKLYCSTSLVSSYCNLVFVTQLGRAKTAKLRGGKRVVAPALVHLALPFSWPVRMRARRLFHVTDNRLENW
jgi:hypothetical protein